MLELLVGKNEKYENESFMTLLTEDEIVDKLLADCVEEPNLQENHGEAHGLPTFLMYAPA